MQMIEQSPLAIYEHDIAQKGYIEDAAQQEALKKLDALAWKINHQQLTSANSLYLWGKVGRGKTYVMDCFYQSVESKAQRMHYYRFMQYLHQRLTFHQGKKDPLIAVAKDLLKSQKVLCLDEFFVSDIADAMLLGRLMRILFEQGMILVTTSNVAPSSLYQDGLQRDRFLPAIKMLEQNLDIINMQGLTDHRLLKAQGLPNYYVQAEAYPAQLSALEKNCQVYARFNQARANHRVEYSRALTIESRHIQCLAFSDGHYLFDFEQLFVGPRSANDYIALCEMAQCIYLINVPQMGGKLNERKVARGTEDTHNINQRVANRPFILAKGDDEARRFISFIDETYDQRKKLIIGAQVALSELYLGGRVEFEFERAYSRIIEMQSQHFGE